MKEQQNLFEDIIQVTINNSDSLSDRSAVRTRVKQTNLQSSNTSFKVEKWTATDNGLTINWKIADTTMGEVLVASTQKGIAFVGFTGGDSERTFADFKSRFPSNKLAEKEDQFHQEAITRINNPEKEPLVHLHLKGSAFQMHIWERLMRVPFGGLTTYLELGESAKNARATGTAVGSNPVSIIIACHRVVRADGSIESYHWGTEIKKRLLGYEVTNVAQC